MPGHVGDYLRFTVDELSCSQLNVTSPSYLSKARQSATADRTGLEWQCVTIEQDHDVNPKVVCKFCAWTGTAGATRIRDHMYMYMCMC